MHPCHQNNGMTTKNQAFLSTNCAIKSTSNNTFPDFIHGKNQQTKITTNTNYQNITKDKTNKQYTLALFFDIT